MHGGWEIGSIACICKNGDNNDIGNYIPIALLADIYKIRDNVITNELIKIINIY